MSQYSDFYSLVLPYADNAASPSMDAALRNAAIEFCQRTLVWQAMSEPEGIAAGVGNYDIERPVGAVPVKVMAVTVNGQQLEPATVNDLEAKYEDWAAMTASQPTQFTQLSPDQFYLVPAPSEGKFDALRYRAAYKPSYTATTLPDMLLHQYGQAIAHGALAMLLMEPGRPYYNPELAMAFRMQVETKITEVALHVAKAFGRAPVRVRPSYF